MTAALPPITAAPAATLCLVPALRAMAVATQPLRRRFLLMEPADHRVELLALVRHLELAAARTDGADLPLLIAVVDVMLRRALAQSKQYRRFCVEEIILGGRRHAFRSR